jgi:dihydrofolate synthase/folylpolyglutamate synthase
MFLGNTLEKIAEEKAGIIKPKTPIIIGETTNETKAVFLKKAKEQAAPILFADSIFKIKNIHQMNAGRLLLNMDVEKNGQLLYIDLKSELLGLYQQKNIPTVLLAIEQLIAVGFIITKEQQIEGIEYVVRNTGLMGRWQVISLQPLVIADTGHNEAGINEVVAQLQQTPHKHLHFVLGMVNDKDISAVLSLLPKTATYYYCRANIPRAMDASLLKNLAQKRGLNGTIYSTVLSALDAAKTNAQQGDLIIIAGSTFTVAEVL